MGCWGVGERQSLEEIMLNDRENIYLGFRFQVGYNRVRTSIGKYLCKTSAILTTTIFAPLFLSQCNAMYTFESVTKNLVTFPRFPSWRLYDNDNAMQIWNKLNNGWPERLWGPVLLPVITNWLIFSGENLGQESSEEKQYQIFDSGLILEE